MPPTVPASDGINGIFAAPEHPWPNSDVPGEAKITLSPPTSNIESGLRPASVSSPSETQQRQQVDQSPSVNSCTSYFTGGCSTFKRGDHLEDRDLGVDNSTDSALLRAKTLDSTQQCWVSDASEGNESVVATICDKYTRAVSAGGYFRCPRYHSKSSWTGSAPQPENSSGSTSSSGWETRSPINDLVPHRSRDPGSSSPHPQQLQQFPSIRSVGISMPTDELALKQQPIE